MPMHGPRARVIWALVAAMLVVEWPGEGRWGQARAAGERGPARPRQVSITRVDGWERGKEAVPGDWVCARCEPPRLCLYAGGTELAFERKGPHVWVRIDGGEAELAGVVAETPAGLAALHEAIEHKVRPLTVWCPIEKGGALPPLPLGDALALSVTGEPSDLSPLARLTHLTHLDLSSCGEVTDLSPLAKLTKLTSLDLYRCEKVSDLGARAWGEPSRERGPAAPGESHSRRGSFG